MPLLSETYNFQKFIYVRYWPTAGLLGDEMTKIKIGKRIRAWRKEREWRGSELARVIKISQGTLSEIETGKSFPSTPTIIKLMTKTDIDIHWVLLGEK
jgi:DNA-binding XRE family transcriptional regulator